MPNTFLTAQLIARQALPILKENMTMPFLVHRDYSNDYKKQGDTIQIRKPAVFVADEFKDKIKLQDVKEENVLVTLDKIADVSVPVTSKEMTLNVEDFNQQILTPAMIAIAEKVNRDLLGLYTEVPYHVGLAGKTPDSLQSFADGRRMLNENKVPLATRRAVWNPEADAQLTIIPAVVNAEKSGTTLALREGSMGRIQGLDNFMEQSVFTHEAGDYTKLDDVTMSASKGAKTIKLESAAKASTGSLKKGDVLTVGGHQYVVVKDTSPAAAGVIGTVEIYPSLQNDVNAGAVIFADQKSGGHVANLAFHESAFALVSRPLELPRGSQDAYVTSFNGLSLRIVFGYDVTNKTQTLSIDTLYGVKCIYPELATRILG